MSNIQCPIYQVKWNSGNQFYIFFIDSWYWSRDRVTWEKASPLSIERINLKAIQTDIGVANHTDHAFVDTNTLH